MWDVKDLKERKDVPFDEIVEYACKSYKNEPSEIDFVEIRDGYGKHIHDADCGYKEGNRLSCMRDCDNSDWIVEISYVCKGLTHGGELYKEFGLPPEPCNGPDGRHRALYGVLDGKFSLWMD